jgi:hypothetical protein
MHMPLLKQTFNLFENIDQFSIPIFNMVLNPTQYTCYLCPRKKKKCSHTSLTQGLVRLVETSCRKAVTMLQLSVVILPTGTHP